MQVFLHNVSTTTQNTAIITRYCRYRLCFPLFQMLHINSRKSASPSSSSICTASPVPPSGVWQHIRICRFILYAGLSGRLPDRDLLFAHVQTSAGLLFCFMTISAALPWLPGPWPQSLILSGVLNFQTSAESFQCRSRTPKCCHSRFPGRRARWVRGTSGNL